MSYAPGNIHQVDCIAGMGKLPLGSVDLAFADPPFNIGYDYDLYDDNQDARAYLDWSRKWIKAVHRALKPTGTFWLAIGDEYAAELKLLSQEIGFKCRSWVIWYYTFGVNCKYKFSRSHAHLFHFVKDPKNCTFNDHEIRIPSARQLVYADSRANPTGRLPDDTWFIRPQDVVDGLNPDEDVWYFPRVAGTFKERAGFHGCQMPEQLLGRIIRACSNAGELVLDPFAGSATTLTVSKKLGRQWIGFEISDEYVRRGRARVDEACIGEPLDGSPEPRISAPPTCAGKASRSARSPTERRHRSATPDRQSEPASTQSTPLGSEIQQAVIEAFARASEGFSADRIVADPDLNPRFIDACERLGVPGTPADINRLLFRLRKAGKLKHIPTTCRTEFDWRACEDYAFASEIALRQMTDREQLTLDELLCSPALAADFDRIAQSFAPGHAPLEYRWAALKLRKDARRFRHQSQELGTLPLPRRQPLSKLLLNTVPGEPGIYLLSDGRKRLYAGEALNMRERLARHVDQLGDVWSHYGMDLQIGFTILRDVKPAKSVAPLFAHQSRLIGKFRPSLNFLDLAAV